MGLDIGSTPQPRSSADPTVNMSRPPQVERPEPHRTRAGATLWRICATVLCLGVHGCTQPTGGAVELSWALRSTLDRDISDCADGRIGRIRLWWETDSDRRWVAFPCEDNHGVTSFDLPTGEVALSITPECRTGLDAAASTYAAPPPLVRDVAIGQAVTLDALLLVVQIDDCGQQPCICLP